MLFICRLHRTPDIRPSPSLTGSFSVWPYRSWTTQTQFMLAYAQKQRRLIHLKLVNMEQSSMLWFYEVAKWPDLLIWWNNLLKPKWVFVSALFNRWTHCRQLGGFVGRLFSASPERLPFLKAHCKFGLLLEGKYWCVESLSIQWQIGVPKPSACRFSPLACY